MSEPFKKSMTELNSVGPLAFDDYQQFATNAKKAVVTKPERNIMLLKAAHLLVLHLNSPQALRFIATRLSDIAAAMFSGFDPNETREEWGRIIKNMDFTKSDIDAYTLTGIFVLLGLTKGNKCTREDLLKLKNSRAVYALLQKTAQNGKSICSPARMALSFPLISMLLRMVNFYRDPVSEDLPGVPDHLRFPAGASCCRDQAEYDAWLSWAKRFNRVINTKVGRNWTEVEWSAKEKDVESYSDNAFKNRFKTLGVKTDNEFKLRIGQTLDEIAICIESLEGMNIEHDAKRFNGEVLKITISKELAEKPRVEIPAAQGEDKFTKTKAKKAKRLDDDYEEETGDLETEGTAHSSRLNLKFNK